MKYLILALVFSAGFVAALATQNAVADGQPPKGTPPKAAVPPPNPNIDMDGYLKVAAEAAKHRQSRRLSEDDFLKMSQEEGVIVLDARSKEMYDLLHVKGAINLSFPDIAIESVKKVLPNKDAKILIYCNNNFRNNERAFASKLPTASLNISTYIALYNYGYRNIYELAPILDPAKSKLTFVSSEKK
jgi:rhodanese-related sulfurtransferase